MLTEETENGDGSNVSSQEKSVLVSVRIWMGAMAGEDLAELGLGLLSKGEKVRMSSKECVCADHLKQA